jgi:hypothetical protein
MENEFLATLVVLFIGATSLIMFLASDWRTVLAALGLKYLWAFILVSSVWPLELAAAKLVTGWMAGAILGLTRLTTATEEEDDNRFPPDGVFKGLVALLVLLVVIGSASRLGDWTRNISIHHAWAGLILLGMGVLQISLSRRMFRSFIGLLMLFSGFEIIYASVEASTLVAGLLGAMNLGIALVGSYLILVPRMEQEE